MGYSNAENIKSVLIDNMSQFVTDSVDPLLSNVGIGMVGWQSAFEYALKNNLKNFAAVMFGGGINAEGNPFAKNMWNWNYIVFLFILFDITTNIDEQYIDMAEGAVQAISENKLTIKGDGHISIVDMLPMEELMEIEGLKWLPVVFNVHIRKEY